MKRRGRPPYPELLTPREQEVLELLREGLSNEQIADRLGVSLAGAKYHVSEILGKLGVSTREEAARWEEQRPWWATALAPIAMLGRRFGWLPQLVAGSALVAVGVAIGFLIWGIARTDREATPSGAVPTLAHAAAPVVLGTGRPGGIAWSPDGKTLLFSPDGIPHLASAPDFTPREMFAGADLATGLGEPHWSPDGSKIAFVGGHQGRFGNPNESSATIYVANSDGSDLRDLLPGAAADLAPTNAKDVDDWLDNDTIVFYQGCGTACRAPYLLNISTGKVEQVVKLRDPTTGELGAPYLGTTYFWSSSKRYVAVEDGEGRAAIRVLDREGTLTELATPPAGFNATTFEGLWQVFDAWSPDSDRFLYEQFGGAVENGPGIPRQLHLYDVTAKRDRLIAQAGIKGTWSPDGQQYAYVAAEFPDSACGGAGDATTCAAVVDAASGDELFRAGPAAYQLDSQNTYVLGPLLLSGRRVIYAAPSGALRMSNGASDVELVTPQTPSAIAASPDGKYLAISEAGTEGRFMVIALDARDAATAGPPPTLNATDSPRGTLPPIETPVASSTPPRPLPTSTPDLRPRASMEVPTLDQLHLGADGKYFIDGRPDGCRWDEARRITLPGEDLSIAFETNCRADFWFEFSPASGDFSAWMP